MHMPAKAIDIRSLTPAIGPFSSLTVTTRRSTVAASVNIRSSTSRGSFAQYSCCKKAWRESDGNGRVSFTARFRPSGSQQASMQSLTKPKAPWPAFRWTIEVALERGKRALLQQPDWTALLALL